MTTVPVKPTGATDPVETTEEEFRRLASLWRAEAAYVSSSSDLIAHPAFREIVGMGTPVIPLLLRELENRTGHWHRALRQITGADPVPPADRGNKAHSKVHDPERCRKIAESLRGKHKPPHVLEAMHAARRGLHHTKETRRRMSKTHRRRGTLVPGTVPWTPAEDEWVRTLSAEEVAQRTGRSLQAVYGRRSKLRVPDGRTKTAGSTGRWRGMKPLFVWSVC
jgi:hypothetical protein